MNKKILLLTAYFLAFFGPSFSQRLAPEKYWVQLMDKKGTKYSINIPNEFLSERSILRREKFDIKITEEDLPVSAAYIDSILSTGVKIHGTTKWFNAIIIETTDSVALEKISKFHFVKDFNTNYSNFSSVSREEGHFHDSPNFDKKYHESYFYGAASSQISILGGTFLHNFGYKGEDILIAVFDAGFNKVDELKAFSHLWEENRIKSYRDFVNPSSNIFEESTHGLAVLSTLAAYIPDTFVGTAPKASYMLLRSEEAARENKAEEAYWILAAEYADSLGADIITSSLGYNDFPTSDKMNYNFDDLNGDSALVTRAAEKAFEKGMVIVSSAGNEGNNDSGRITPPADGPNVLAVGSIDTAYNITSYSSRGNTYDGRIKPDVMAVGFRTKIINSIGNPSEAYGTSFAAPQVAGLIACLMQATSDKTHHEIIQAVRKSSSQYQNPDSISGYGIPNFIHALWELKKDSGENQHHGFIAHPNPFTAIVELQTTSPDIGIQQIDIFSSEGKLIHSNNRIWQPGEKIMISELQKYSPGVYYLVAHSTEGEIVTKLIKQ
ncbi:MAG: S8 family peptidase [Bacteroidota bacterium]